MVPEKIRVSIGSAAVLGLEKQRMDVLPSTAYLMLYSEHGCIGNCSFCPQARDSSAEKKFLSRILWPAFSVEKVLEALKINERGTIERICIQVINYPGFYDDVIYLVEKIKSVTKIPISLDSSPLGEEELKKLQKIGVERISIPLDAATEELFDKVKGKDALGPYTWKKHFKALRKAVKIFGQGNVMSNLILGLGETEMEAISIIQELADIRVPAVLFAFTPIRGTKLSEKPQPEISYYRRVQVARALILEGKVRMGEMKFEKGKVVDFGINKKHLREFLKNGKVFQTTGCPGCNRPYYNERPSGPFYNFPRPLTPEEVNSTMNCIGVEI
jgi:biotin synthase